MNLVDLKNKLKNYTHIFFDLDDTIYSIYDFDNGAFFEIASKFLPKPLINVGHTWLLNYKNDQPEGRLFSNFLSNFQLPTKYEKTCIEMYQSFNCNTLDKKRSLYSFIIDLKIDGKFLYLVTNGNYRRQERKINALGLNDIFDGISIGDPLVSSNLMKPNISILNHFGLNTNNLKCVMIGDNQIIDGGFATNANIDFLKFKFYI